MNNEMHINIKNSRPKKIESQIIGFSQDKTGDFSFETEKFKTLGKIKINKISKFIFDLCNGTNTIEEIAQKVQEKYSVPGNVDIYTDIDRVLHQYFRIGVIEFLGDNYILERYQCIYESYMFQYLQFDDTYEATKEFKEYRECVSPYVNYDLATSSDVLKTTWNSAIESTFEIKNSDKVVVACMTVQPDVRIKGFRILAIKVKDKTIEKCVMKEFFRFVYHVYSEAFQMSDKMMEGNDLLFQYYSFEPNSCHNIFQLDGELKQEINNKSTYVYSCNISDEMEA